MRFTQEKLDQIVAKLGLTQKHAEYLVRESKKHGVTTPKVRITAYKDYQVFLTES